MSCLCKSLLLSLFVVVRVVDVAVMYVFKGCGSQEGLPPTSFRGDLDTFNFSLLIFAKLKVSRVFALELKLSKTLRGLVYFVL